MWHFFFQKLVNLCGKDYKIDPALPELYLFRFCMRRLVWLVWGILRMRTWAFVAPSAVIEQSGNLMLSNAATLEPYVKISAAGSQPICIGRRTKIGAYSQIVSTAHLSKAGKGLMIGDDSGCGEFCYFGAVGGISIGSRVIMGQYVSFHAQEHFYKDTLKPVKDQGTSEKGITVGNDCWIGAKTTILDGTVIGNHCVIAAGAVVKGQFPDHSVIGGVPARIIRDLQNVA